MLVSKTFVATAALFLTSSLTSASPAPILSLREANAFNPSVYNNPTHGTPSHYFAANPSLPVKALAAAANKGSKQLDSFPLGGGGSKKVPIYGDWADLGGVGAYYWTADMDIDCDGLNYNCKGNGDGQQETNFGALSAYAVPWSVIPQRFVEAHRSALQGNNLVAVICNGKMFYSIFGDTQGVPPLVIGEASWLLARTCFPNDNLDGATGHTKADVTYIAFTGSGSVLPSSALNSHYITNYDKLKSLGDELVDKLVKKVKL